VVLQLYMVHGVQYSMDNFGMRLGVWRVISGLWW
jgi:hypothetical protein